jgi:structural maintenance of chromosomes protein 5
MKKKVPWLKYDMMKKEFIEVIQEKEKIAKQEMEEAARVWEDSKGPIEYVPWFQKVSAVHFWNGHSF